MKQIWHNLKHVSTLPNNKFIQHAHRFFHLGVHVHFYLHFWGYIQICGGAMYSLTLHLGVQRKLNAFSPRKVMHHAVFCKYYAELAKTFFSVWPMAFVSVPPFLFVVLYITCQILFFIQNWMQDYLYVVMIIKQLN